MLGTTIDWVNGSSRRGSLRLSEKSQINYHEKGDVVAPPIDIVSTTPAKKSRKGRSDDSYLDTDSDTVEVKKQPKPRQSVSIPTANGTDVPAKPTKSHWTDDEKSKFKQYLSTYGKDWNKIAEFITTKSTSQIKNYFQNYRVKLKLDELLPEGERSKRRSGKKGKRGRPKAAKGEDGDSVEDAL